MDVNFLCSGAGVLLGPFGQAYSFLARIREFILSKNKISLSRPVISVGNVSVGGTGKTPFCVYLARSFGQKKLNPVILTRGYKAKPPDYPYLVPSDGDPLFCGDEPLLLARHTPAQVVIDPDRVRAAQFALANLKPDLFILDDGFGQIKIKKDLDIVLFTLRDFFFWDQVLPAGLWREGRSALKRAHLFLVNLQGHPKFQLLTLAQKKLFDFNKPVLFFDYVPQRLRSSWGDIGHTLKKYFLVTTLAHAKKIVRVLERFLGFPPLRHFNFPDHYNFSRSEARGFQQLMKHGCELVCTYKEAEKLKKVLPQERFWILESKIKFSTQAEEEIFWSKVGVFL
ncbi:MAG: tetraacyldisaccharide 4'-kinase [Desulfonauticus sp.]|nr:tetraacyldisaccharide 4'-kinase [Desulfonauticus sp.]